jgi:flagellar biosynthetic protein FlhB
MKYSINLQLFSDSEKTEKPTPKKRRDARKEGQVLQSREITSAFILLASILGLRFIGKYEVNYLLNFIRSIYSNIENVDKLFSNNDITANFIKVVTSFFIIVGPILAIAFISAIAINYLQVGFFFSTKPLNVKLNRINPVEGFKRIFSKKALLELVKSILKVGLIGFVGYKYIADNIHLILNIGDFEAREILTYFSNLSFYFLIRVVSAVVVIAFIDYFFQWRQHEKSLMMTKQEIKEEYKQTEGDPLIKSKIKEKQRQMAMSRMMQEVPKADVIITNPTHLAVAIKYDKDLYKAPYVVAKGQGLIAENIKKVAKENQVPIVENKAVARALYETLDIGDLIPEELYEAIAEILAYVYSLKDNH